MSLFYCSDVNMCFQLIMAGENCAVYDCSSVRATPVVSQSYDHNTGATLEEQHCRSYY